MSEIFNLPCLCGDPLCPRCFPQANEAYGHEMMQAHAERLAACVADYLAFLEPDSLIDQKTDSLLRQERELAEHNLRNALAMYRGE